MLGPYRQTLPVTEDPLPLPSGFYTLESRRCEFFSEDRTPGFRGIAFAIVLRALEDGVCERWLRFLKDFYDVTIPEKYLVRTPERQLRINLLTRRMSGVGPPKILLSWFDVLPITAKQVA